MVRRWKNCGGKCGGEMVEIDGEKAVSKRRGGKVLVEYWWERLVVKMVVKGGGSCGGK